MFDKFLTSNKTSMRLLRTIIEIVIGYFVSYADVIFGFVVMPDELRPVVVGLVVAIMTAILSFMRGEEEDHV